MVVLLYNLFYRENKPIKINVSKNTFIKIDFVDNLITTIEEKKCEPCKS